MLPVGLLRGTFFDENRPQYMNYGALGFIIGHEITHGFDNRGIQFDKDGNHADWWGSEPKRKYSKKSECLINQYNKYFDEEVGLKVSFSFLLITNTNQRNVRFLRKIDLKCFGCNMIVKSLNNL